MTQRWLRDAAVLAETHALSFYDASWAAAAAALDVPLVSADRRLLAAGLAVSPSAVAARLNLAM
jgi:predicted nucleic acid-binding protein